MSKKRSTTVVAMIALVAQTSSTILLLRYSRIRNQGQGKYLNSTAVVMSELLKAFTCLILVHLIPFEGFSAIAIESSDIGFMLRLMVPAIMYTVQNNLLFLALSNLNAVVYQITYQFKILTTAVFSVLLLNKKLSRRNWLSLLCLTCGVCCIQLNELGKSVNNVQNTVIGLVAVMIANITSGFSGVYFEKMLKSGISSIWMQNLFLACYSVVIGLVNCMVNDGDEIRQNGFLYGYNSIVWLVVFLQAVGGLIIAIVIKHADNIAKTFANSVSIVLSAIVSYTILKDLSPSTYFYIGASVVIASTIAYNYEGKIPFSRRSISRMIYR